MLADAICLWWSGGTSQTGLTGKELCSLIERLKKAWSISQLIPLTGYCPKRMSFSEVFIRSLYFRLQEEQGETEEARTGYLELLAYLKTRANIREQAMIYPQIALRCLGLLPETKEGDQKKAVIWEDYQAILKQQGDLSCLVELTEWHTAWQGQGSVEQSLPEKMASIEELPDSLRWLYEHYQIQPFEWLWYLLFGMDYFEKKL